MIRPRPIRRRTSLRELEQIQKEHEEERNILGTTKLELLEELDRRTPELAQVVLKYDTEQSVSYSVLRRMRKTRAYLIIFCFCV